MCVDEHTCDSSQICQSIVAIIDNRISDLEKEEQEIRKTIGKQ